MKEIKNKIEHNEGILREIQNRIMKEIWSIILTSLNIVQVMHVTLGSRTGHTCSKHNTCDITACMYVQACKSLKCITDIVIISHKYLWFVLKFGIIVEIIHGVLRYV